MEFGRACRTRQRHRVLRSAILFASIVVFLPSAHATEGALGRPISGTGVQSNAGVVAPEPIWAVNIGEVYQEASIGGGRQVPIVGKTSLGLSSRLSLTTATLLKTWDTGPGQWNFASSFTLPYDWNKVTARLTTDSGVDRSQSQSASNLFDLYFTPIMAGYHFSQTEHLALAFNVWTDTGKYDVNNLTNPSLNNWTFIPSVSYTKMLPDQGVQFDATLGLQFYTRNTATDYQNAPLLTLDMLLTKQVGNGFGVGVVVGWVQQLGDDTGPTADKLNGFVGYDVSVGPYISYTTKLGDKAPLEFGLRWVPTVASKNRLSGDAVMGTASLIF